jgi:hypothetical protein
MRRLVWVGIGAALGVWALQRARRTATALTPAALVDSVRAATRAFTGEVRAGMAEREAELREQLGIESPPPPGESVG